MQRVALQAYPQGTTVRIQPGSNDQLATASIHFLSRAQYIRLHFEKPGFETQIVELNRRVAPSSSGSGPRGGTQIQKSAVAATTQ